MSVAQLRPIHLITGDAAALVERAVSELVAQAEPACEPAAFNVGTWRAADAGADEAVVAARTPPMFAAQRLVVVRDLHDAPATLVAALADYAASPDPSTILVLCGQRVPADAKDADAGARLVKAARAHGEARSLSVRDISPPRFAHERAAELGKVLRRPAAELLVEVVGADLSRLSREVEKLASYVGDAHEIGVDAIEQACALLTSAEVWDLTTAIASRRAGDAVTALHRLHEGGEPSHKMIAMVTWQLRAVMTAAGFVRAGMRPRDAARKAGLRGGLEDRIDPALLRSPDALDVAGLAERITAANHAMNSRRVGERRVFEALVLELCQR